MALIDPMGSIPVWAIALGKTKAAAGIPVMAQLLMTRHGSVRSPPLPPPSSPPKSQNVSESDTESDSAVDDDDLFFDTQEYNPDFEVPDEKIPLPRTTSTSRALAVHEELEIQKNLKELLQQLQNNAKNLQNRLENLEKTARATGNGIYVSWRCFLGWMGWPVLVLLLYHFVVRRRLNKV